MRETRIVAIGLALGASILGLVWTWATWHKAEPLPAGDTGQQDLSLGQGSELAVAAERERTAIGDEGTTNRSSVTPATSEASTTQRVCPDLEPLIAELCEILQDENLSVEGYLGSWLAARTNDLDAHCARELEALSQAMDRSAVERLAALSLLSGVDQHVQPAQLTGSERSLLWQVYDVEQPSPIEPISTGDTVPTYRGEIAQVAGMCLAVLGDRSDLERLFQGLSGPEPASNLAALSLAHARSSDAAELFLVGLTDPSIPTRALLRGMTAMLDDPARLDGHPALLERAIGALDQRWQAAGSDQVEVRRVGSLLASIDPELLAERCAQLLAEGRAGPNVNFAANVLVDRSAPRDLEQIGGMLIAGSDVERLAAARAVSGHLNWANVPTQLSDSALAALGDLAVSSHDPALRREALLAAQALAHDFVSTAIRALDDEDAGVREAATFVLARGSFGDPAVIARLETVARSDGEARVRKAAAQALRHETGFSR